MSDVFILSACRTAIGSFNGQFEGVPATELGSITISEAIKRARLEPTDVEQTIIGHILTAGQGQNTGRQAAVKAKIPYTSPGYTVNMLCGSGMKSVCLGYNAIRNNDCSIVVVGGQENMSRAQHTTYLRGNKLGSLNLGDSLLIDGLTDAFHDVHMGNTAEHLAKLYNVSKEAQEIYAAKSQQKAENAVKSGHFVEEIVPVPNKKGEKIDTDQFPRFGTTVESLAKLRPCFQKDGSVTAGTSSGMNDGAAALVLADQQAVTAKQLKPLARIVAYAEVGLDPLCMGLGPIKAVENVLKKAAWSKDDVDLYELNEAFAVQSIIVVEQLNLPESKVNVSGGAIALGHPIGASGARVIVTLLHNMKRLNKKRGVAALCIGGGMGISMAIELC